MLKLVIMQDDSLKLWIKTLPYSRLVCSTSFKDRMKYVFWWLYTPFHPFARDVLIYLGILRHSSRQDYLIGTLAPGQSVREFVSFLITQGYGNHFIAWRDDGELLSLRYLDGFERQYHLRIFEDGEVRGHYEFTPESYPIRHFKAIGQEDRRDEFLRLLGDRIIPLKQ